MFSYKSQLHNICEPTSRSKLLATFILYKTLCFYLLLILLAINSFPSTISLSPCHLHQSLHTTKATIAKFFVPPFFKI